MSHIYGTGTQYTVFRFSIQNSSVLIPTLRVTYLVSDCHHRLPQAAQKMFVRKQPVVCAPVVRDGCALVQEGPRAEAGKRVTAFLQDPREAV